MPGPPAGYPRFRSPPGARAGDPQHRLRRLQHRVQPLGRSRARRGSTPRAGRSRAPACPTPARSRRAAQRRRLLMLRARGVKVAFLSYTQHTNGIPLPHPWSVNLASAGRILRDARRARRAGARVVIVNLHWGTEYRARAGRVPDRARPPAVAARARSPRWSASTPTWCSRSAASVASGSSTARATCCPAQGALVLPGGEPGRDARATARARRPAARARGPHHVHADLGAAPGLQGRARGRRVAGAHDPRGGAAEAGAAVR